LSPDVLFSFWPRLFFALRACPESRFHFKSIPSSHPKALHAGFSLFWFPWRRGNTLLIFSVAAFSESQLTLSFKFSKMSFCTTPLFLVLGNFFSCIYPRCSSFPFFPFISDMHQHLQTKSLAFGRDPGCFLARDDSFIYFSFSLH